MNIWNKALLEKQIGLRITGLYALRPLRGLGFRKPQSGFALYAALLQHIFCARKNASHFFLSGTKKHRIQPERYLQLRLK